VDQLPPIAAGAGKEHRRLLFPSSREKDVVKRASLVRGLTSSSNTISRGSRPCFFIDSKYSTHCPGDMSAAIDADADAGRFRMRADDAEARFSRPTDSASTRSHRSDAVPMRGDEAVHHVELGLRRASGRTTARRNIISWPMVPIDWKSSGYMNSAGVVRGELPAAADETGRESRIRLQTSTGRGSQPELGNRAASRVS